MSVAKGEKMIADLLKLNNDYIQIVIGYSKTRISNIKSVNENMGTDINMNGHPLSLLVNVIELERTLLKENGITEELYNEFKKHVCIFFDKQNELSQKEEKI